MNSNRAPAIVLALALLAAAASSYAEGPQPFLLPPAISTSAVRFTSDHFDYERSSGVIHLQGHVELHQSTETVRGPAAPGGKSQTKTSTTTIRAHEVFIDLEEKRAKAFGFVEVEEERNMLFGDSGEFQLDDKSGFVDNASAGYPPWRIHGRRADLDPEHTVYFHHARFTSCNSDPKVHYHFRATALCVKPKRYMYSTNTVFFLGPVPMFYLPFFYKSLDPDPILRTRLFPGHDHRNGYFGKTTTFYDPNRYAHGKLFLDYYQLQGWGVGDETLFNSPGGHGGFYGYRIEEHHNGADFNQLTFGPKRWVIVGDHVQSLPDGYNFQTRFQTQSDPNFNNDYARSSRFPVTPELDNSAALTRAIFAPTLSTSTPKITLGIMRVSYSRLDMMDPTTLRYEKQTESLPRLDFNSAAFTIPHIPLLNTASLFADHTFARGQGFLQNTAGASVNTSRTFLLRGISFTPSLTGEDIYSKINAQSYPAAGPITYLDSFTPDYTARGNVRFNTPVGSWDAAQTYQGRMRTNTFNVDKDAVDYGVMQNISSLADVIYPTRSVFFRIQGAYDWRVFRDHMVGFRDRVQPMTADLNWAPRNDVSVTFRDSYQLDGGNQAFAMQADYGDRKKDYASFGFSNSTFSASHYYVSEEFGWRPFAGSWRLGTTIRSDVRTSGGAQRLNTMFLFDKELWIMKDWHDFKTQVFLRSRTGNVKEATFQVQLSFDPKRDIADQKREDKFRAPWHLWQSQSPDINEIR